MTIKRKFKIHIFGASGSGTTTLGSHLAIKLNYKHFDNDEYYWLSTEPPFEEVRPIRERQFLLMKDLRSNHSWVLTGSMCGWGDVAIPLIDLVVFLLVPTAIRLKRLRAREKERYGSDILPGNPLYNKYTAFIQWASEYDSGDINMRSRTLHEEWLKKIPCDILRIEGDYSIDEQIEIVSNKIFN